MTTTTRNPNEAARPGDLDEEGIANLKDVFPAAIAKIEAAERRNTVERIRTRLVENGWHEDGDEDHWPVKFGWGSLESDLDRILDEVAK